MDAIQAILTRRSIRSYNGKKVPDDILNQLLNAGMNAPSAGNEQPWHFIILEDRTILDKIPEFHPFSSMLAEVSTAILVCGDLKLEKYKGFWVQDCSAATQNILLAANALGLGSVWLGIYPHMDRVEGFRKLLKLPENIMPLSLLPVGYSDELPGEVNRFYKSRIHYNRW